MFSSKKSKKNGDNDKLSSSGSFSKKSKHKNNDIIIQQPEVSAAAGLQPSASLTADVDSGRRSSGRKKSKKDGEAGDEGSSSSRQRLGSASEDSGRRSGRYRDTLDSGISSKGGSSPNLTASVPSLYQPSSSETSRRGQVQGEVVAASPAVSSSQQQFRRTAARASMKKAYGVYEPLPSSKDSKDNTNASTNGTHSQPTKTHHSKSVSVPAPIQQQWDEEAAMMTQSAEHLAMRPPKHPHSHHHHHYPPHLAAGPAPTVSAAASYQDVSMSFLQPTVSESLPKKHKKKSSKNAADDGTPREKPKKSKKTAPPVDSGIVTSDSNMMVGHDYTASTDAVFTDDVAMGDDQLSATTTKAKLKRSASDHKPPKAKHKDKLSKAGADQNLSASSSALPPMHPGASASTSARNSLSPQLSFSGLPSPSSTVAKQQMSPSLSFTYRRPSSISDSYNFISVDALCANGSPSDPDCNLDLNRVPPSPSGSTRRYSASGWEQKKLPPSDSHASPQKSSMVSNCV